MKRNQLIFQCAIGSVVGLIALLPAGCGKQQDANKTPSTPEERRDAAASSSFSTPRSAADPRRQAAAAPGSHEGSAGRHVPRGATRTGIRNAGIIAKYSYGEGVGSAIGIPNGATYSRARNHREVGKPVMVASDAELVDEPIDGKTTRVIRVKLSLRNESGAEVAEAVAFYRPFSDSAHVAKVLLSGRFEMVYHWGDLPGYSLATVTVTDTKSHEKVCDTHRD